MSESKPLPRRPYVKVGRFLFYLWSGSWSWWDRLDCDHCHNVYLGPFGFEWLKDELDTRKKLARRRRPSWADE